MASLFSIDYTIGSILARYFIYIENSEQYKRMKHKCFNYKQQRKFNGKKIVQNLKRAKGKKKQNKSNHHK